MVKKLSHALLNIVIIILVIIASISFYLNYKYNQNPNQVPKFFGYTSFEVLSGSMLPTYDIGDRLIVKEVPANELEEKDVITFRDSDGVIITHRIESKEIQGEKVFYYTKGDNNNTIDKDIVPHDKVIGKVVFNFILLKWIDQMTRSPILLISFIVIIIIVIISVELYRKNVATD